VVAITCVGIAFRNVPFPRIAIFSPISLFAAVLGDAATTLVLLGTWRHSPSRRSTFVLALSFGVNALLTLLTIFLLPVLPKLQPVLSAPSQSAPWLYIAWHVGAALGGLAFIVLRRDRSSQALSRRFALTALALAAAYSAATVTIAIVFSARLPALVDGPSLAGFVTSGVGPLAMALLTVVTLLAFRIRGPTLIDRTLAVSLLAITLDIMLLLIGGRRYTVSFFASRLLIMLGGTFVLGTAVYALVASRTILSRVESEAAQRAARIRALWQIASDTAASKEERFHNMLKIAAETIRRDKPMFGALSHLEGGTVVLDAIFAAASLSAAREFATTRFVGARFPLRTSILSLVVAEKGTQAWDDLLAIDAGGLLQSGLAWRSLIATSVSVGKQTYYVSFGSTETTLDEPYAEDDIAYVDVVASFIVGRMTEQMQFEQIQFELEHDALTGLENRVQFRNAVREAMAAGRPFAIAFADLDGFRFVNEREGNQIGDDLLVEVAHGLKAVDAHDLVARMSADEFGIMLCGADGFDSTAKAVGAYSNVFRERFSAGSGGEERLLDVGACIGVSRFPQDGASYEELVRHASVALGVAKERGASTTLLFDAPMQAILDASHLRFIELSEAIAKDQLVLAYQPTFDLATREIVGAEALVRWDHPVRGRLPPLEFIEFAERNGLMGPLSRWVLDRVARDVSRRDVSLPAGFRIYFNLGAAMLDDVPFIARLNEVLLTTPGLVAHLGVEVTESAAMQNVERSVNTIELFRRWGLSVAIDDFGTGHSSLAYLKQLTVDVVKIDRSFISGLPEDDRDAALAETLLRIIDRFAFKTLAEGIETEAQAAWLLAHGCRLGQGYLVARPAPFDELLGRIRPLGATA
jgi:diguanylate cyclase (GGDEF)-like protein